MAEDDIRLESSGEIIPKQDPASDFRNDGSGASSDSDSIAGEMLKRQVLGRRMSVCTAFLLSTLTIAFFWYAVHFAHSFVNIYKLYISRWLLSGQTPEMPVVLPLMVPVVPALSFSILGMLTMITGVRFITAYINPQDEDQDGALLQRLIREIAGAIKSLKGGGSGD